MSAGDRESKLLGMDVAIQRRDFIVGGALAATVSGCAQGDPDAEWNGYGGEGPYSASNGNVAATRDAAHELRDGLHTDLSSVIDTGERYDVIVIGAGIAGLTAAITCRDEGDAKCLVLDNHPIFGGEAKENEFHVDGRRLFGPQGSNDFGLLAADDVSEHAKLWRRLGIPGEFEFAPQPANFLAARENFVPMYWNLDAATIGYFFENGAMARDIWQSRLADTPWPEEIKQDLIRWRLDREHVGPTENRDRWLDSMSYGALMSREMGLGPAPQRFIDPVLATSAYGVTADAISAYAAAQLRMPGAADFDGVNPLPRAHETYLSFPGGNSGIARYLAKRLVPQAIDGPDTLEGVITGRVNVAALDNPENAARLRMRATAVAARHAGEGANSAVEVIYVKDGRRYSALARSVVVAAGGWVSKYVVRDLPAAQRQALDKFVFAPILVVNVALRNWRFLDRLGISAARWFEGFGFFANIRRPMRVGPDTAPFDPDEPIVLTLYASFHQQGLGAAEQATHGRAELLSATFADFERRIRTQLATLFACAGFDPRRDIAAIVLNRWGHALIAPQPGFYFDTPDAPAYGAAAQAQFGRISFGHSQFGGHQNWSGAVAHGARAAREALAAL
ncbi:MAG: FAD-binding protein [Hyphomonadaceae bacterium]